MVGPERPPPLESPDPDGVRVIVIGTGIWALAFLVLLPFRQRLADAGNDSWLWIAAAGFGLGLIGIWMVRRRRARLERGS